MMNRDHFYILDHKTKQPIRSDITTWIGWLETADRTVKETVLRGDLFISTAFLGMAYAYENGKPLLFATIVTGGKITGYANHYATWDDAVAGHHEMVGLVLLAEASDSEDKNE